MYDAVNNIMSHSSITLLYAESSDKSVHLLHKVLTLSFEGK